LSVGWFLKDAGTGEWELYNLKDDIGETKNLAAQYPEKVERLKNCFNPARQNPQNKRSRRRAERRGKERRAERLRKSNT